MFDWHFTLRGPRDTEFVGGIYHGRILLPADYPFKPPNIMLLTVLHILLAFCLFLYFSNVFAL
jgi:ubiquitin-protein ligase